MNTIFTSQYITTAVLAGLVLLFWGLEWIARQVFKVIQESLATATSASGTLSGTQIEKYSRVASAALVLKFVSVLVKTTATLGLALGIFKAFTDLFNLVLPEGTLALAVLMSYCGLFVTSRAISDDIGQAFRKLFA
jgi:hypothetical protein